MAAVGREALRSLSRAGSGFFIQVEVSLDLQLSELLQWLPGRLNCLSLLSSVL